MVRAFIAALLASIAIASAAADEPYPSRPITLVVAFPPGGVADQVARPTAHGLQKILHQPVVVLNKPGAGGAIGSASVATAKPDGYTLLMALSSISTNPESDRVAGRTVEYYIWSGLFAPAGTPDGVMQRLREAMKQVVEDSEFKTSLAKLETPIVYLDAPAFQKFFEQDAQRLIEVVRQIGKIE
jgi:tripartite-type tricarboxylate transporter receptor subunit TctC